MLPKKWGIKPKSDVDEILANIHPVPVTHDEYTRNTLTYSHDNGTIAEYYLPDTISLEWSEIRLLELRFNIGS